MKLLSGTLHPQLSQEVAQQCGVTLTPVDFKTFSDGEILVQIQENLRGEDVFIIQPTGGAVNDSIMELAILIDAARRGSARRITAVIPYFGYARQDRKTAPGTPITAKLVADLLTAAGADRVLTVDLHAPQLQGFFNIPLDNLSGCQVFQQFLADAKLESFHPMIISPDVGGLKRARAFAEVLGLDLAVIDKRRNAQNAPEVMHVMGDVQDRSCLIVDDIVDSGRTLVACAEALRKNGASQVQAFLTHGVLGDGALERLSQAKIDQIWITDSLPIDKKIEVFGKIGKISVAKTLSNGIKSIHEEKSLLNFVDPF